MTLERIEHKVFASEAPLEEMGQFGSALATTKLNTKDVAEIQALPAYTKGWGSAIISENNYPAMEEMNGVLNVMSYHTGYLYQEGIPTYSATQEYSATSWVKDLAGKNIYKSKKDNNIGNDLNDSEWFERVDFGENSLKTNQITNCILEIPQRIKLELKDGTLTLKAGSKVIVPNSAGVFDEVIISSDISVTSSVNDKMLIFINNSKNLHVNKVSNVFSGTTAPTSLSSGVNYIWYDTTNNIVKLTADAGSSWTSGFSLPLGLITGTGVITSIDQVFNGIGYIGSIIWVDKGVKVLMPNGRNEDGTLNNVEFSTSNLIVRTFVASNNGYRDLFVNQSAITILANYSYNAVSNFNINTDLNTVHNGCLFGSVLLNNGVVSNFQPKQPFRAVDYSDLTDLMPTGAIISSASSTTPTGFLYCNGSAVSRTTYAKLFSAIGTTYGTGDGSTTFNLPNYSNYNFVTSGTVSVKGTGKGLMITNGSVTSQLMHYANDSTLTFGPSQETSSVNYGSTTTKRGASSSSYDNNKVCGVVTNASTSGLTGSVSTATIKWYIKY